MVIARLLSTSLAQTRGSLLHLIIFHLALTTAQSAEATCTSPAAAIGAREYFTANNTYRLCKNLGWQSFFTNATAGSCVAGSAGRMEFNSTDKDYRYCNGSNWLRIGGTACTPNPTYSSRVVDATNLNAVSRLRLHDHGDKVIAVGQWSQRVAIYSIANAPSAPTLVGVTSAITWLNDSSDFVTNAGYVYAVARGNRNVAVVNVSDPANPTYVTRVQASTTNQMTNVWGIALSKDKAHAFTVSFNSGSPGNCWMHTLDLSSPASPSVVAAYNLSTPSGAGVWCDSIRVHEDTAYVIFSSGYVVRVDVTNPASPSYLSNVYHADGDQQRSAGFSYNNNYLFTGTTVGTRFVVWNISAAHPGAMTRATTLTNANFGEVYGMEILGNFALVAGYSTNRLNIVDVTNPTSPTVGTSLLNTNLGGPQSPLTVGRYSFLPGYNDHSIAVVDLGCDPLSSGPLGSCSAEGRVEYLTSYGALAWCDGSQWKAMGK